MAIDPFASLLLDQDPATNSTVTVSRTNGLITGISFVDTSTGNTLKTVTVARTNGLITTITTTAYLPDGVTVDAVKVETLTRTNGLVTQNSTARTT